MKLGSNEIGLVKVTELIHLSDIFCQLRISLNLAELQLSTFFFKISSRRLFIDWFTDIYWIIYFKEEFDWHESECREQRS